MARPAAAVDHRRRVDRLTLALLLAIRRLWRTLEPKGAWEDQYQDSVGPQILALVLAAQTGATRGTDTYVAELLNELAFGPTTTPGVVPPNAFTGLAGDGRPVDTLLATTVGRARASLVSQRERLLGPESQVRVIRPPDDQMLQQALADGEAFMSMVAASIMADTVRAAEAVAMAPREWVAGWVRMITPPCCSRCAILCGKFYLWSDGFERHPGCDCYHAPAPAKGPALDQLLAVNTPQRYFDSLTDAEQDRYFTAAGAQAIRDGADIAQVVNARNPRSGMSTAQVAGRQVLISTEGTTRQGLAYKDRTGRTMTARLMPESIYELAAGDRAEAIRLLRLNGFIL